MDTVPTGDEAPDSLYQNYLDSSSTPLTCFLFSLPLFIVYHAGLWWLTNFAGLEWANAIDIAIANGLGMLGMAGPLLSFILVIIVFLSLHAASRRMWSCPPLYVWVLMIVESLILSLPVFFLSRITPMLADLVPPLSALDGSDADLSWKADMILSCGAGVYEEFFFRLLVMGILSFILGRIFGIQGSPKYILAALLQSLLFAASHHLPDGPEAVLSLAAARDALPVFSFRAAAGLYFALLYIKRGFGIAAGAHAGYDVMVVLLDIFMPLDTVG